MSKFVKFDDELYCIENYDLLKDNQFVGSPFAINRLLKLKEQNKIMREALEFYAYPKNEDGDRAYIFGHEARQALGKINTHKK